MKNETYEFKYVVNDNEIPCIAEYERQYYTQEEIQIYQCRSMEIEVIALWLFPNDSPKSYNLMDGFSWILGKGDVFEIEEEIREKLVMDALEARQEAMFQRECEECF